LTMLPCSFADKDGIERVCRSIEDLTGLINSGAITPATFFWDDQKQSWLKAMEFAEYVRAKETLDDARNRRLQQNSIRPRAAVDFREPSLRHARLLDYSAGNPNDRIRKASMASKGLIVLGGLFASAILWQVLASLSTTYGVDKLPPRGLWLSATAINVTQYIWYFGMLACLVYCFYQAHVVLKTCCGAELRYRFNNTVGSMFIPIVFFYRPWVGLAEIRRKSIELRFNVTMKFDVYTVILAVASLSLGVTVVAANGEIARLLTQAGGADVDRTTTAIGLELMEVGAVIAMTMFCYYYCRSAVIAVKELLAMRSKKA